MRVMVHYLMFTTSKEYPDLHIKGFPYTFLPTIVAYKLTLLIGHTLLCDLHSIKPTTSASSSFLNDPVLIKFLNLLKSLPVPQDVQVLIDYINPILDTQRQNLKFVPSFSAFSFQHDFGYSIPSTCFLQIHNVFPCVCNKTNSDPIIIMAKLYNCPVITTGDKTYTIGNLFGGPYSINNDTHIRNNWLNRALEGFINPVISRALLQRPTFAKTPCVLYTADQPQLVNGYQYLLEDPIGNEFILHAMLTDIERFLFDSTLNLPLLGTLLSKTSGLTIATHAIESPNLPTWHGLPTINIPAKEENIKFELQSDVAYATAIKFMNGAPSFTKTLKYSSEDVEERLYLVEDEKFNPNTNPLTYLTFSKKNYQATPVLWFQPYDKSSQSIELSIPLGYRIVNSEIDGITIPVPNPSHDTTLNNPFYRQG